MNLNDVKTGVKTLLTGTDFETAITRIYYATAPENPTYPHCIWSMPEIPEERDSSIKINDITLVFNIYTTDSSSVNATTYANLLKTVFDDSETTLTIANQRVRRVTKEFENEFPADDNQAFGWLYSLRYQVLIH